MTDTVAAIETLLARAAELGAERALAKAAEQAPSRLIPLRESPCGYRLTLSAINAGELTKYTVGGRSYIERSELEAWILAHPVRPTAPTEPAAELDEVDALLEGQRAERARRARKHV